MIQNTGHWVDNKQIINNEDAHLAKGSNKIKEGGN